MFKLYFTNNTQASDLTWEKYITLFHVPEKISWSQTQIDQTIDFLLQAQCPGIYSSKFLDILELIWYETINYKTQLYQFCWDNVKLKSSSNQAQIYRWCPSTRGVFVDACACDSSYRQIISSKEKLLSNNILEKISTQVDTQEK